MTTTTAKIELEFVSDRWIDATWEEFNSVSANPDLQKASFYYDHQVMRIEMSPLGPLHAHENSIVSNVVRLFTMIKNIPVYEYTNCSFRQESERECQPDIAFYLGSGLKLPPKNNSAVDLNIYDLPTLIVEIDSTTIQDDLGFKRLLYERLGIQEYWVVNAYTLEVFAFRIVDQGSNRIKRSLVLPGLEISTVEEALRKSEFEDDGAIARWLLKIFQEGKQ
jgi:Uma2 family endonuclease